MLYTLIEHATISQSKFPVRMVQIIFWLAVQDYSCQKCQTINVQKLSKFTFWNSSAGRIKHLPEVFWSLIQNLKVKCSVKSDWIMAHKTQKFFTWYLEKKINDSRNSPKHEDCSGWQSRKTRLQWLMFGSSVATCRLASSSISLLINEKRLERSPGKGRT